MATAETPVEKKVAVKEMSWDPVTRIVGSLGIHTEIDFANQQVLKCCSTSMIFRGFDIFMKGIDPRDAHFITSRICGICGDNHCTCSCLNQNMAYGVKPPLLGDYAFNLAESADFMFDHAIFNDCMANVDYSEQVKDTNPSLLKRAEETSALHSDIHGYKTIADIMRALNAFTGSFYLETLQVARYTREMYCLFGGRHTHPSTIMPGGCSADITHQTLTDYYVRLMRYMDYCKRTVPMHDDPMTSSTRRCRATRSRRLPRHRPRVLGRVRRPAVRRLQLPQHDRVGAAAVRHPGPGVQGRADHHGPRRDQPRDPHPARLLVLRRLDQRADLRHPRPARQRGRQAPPVEQGDAALPQARDWADKYSWSPRRACSTSATTFVANDTGGGPFARQWVTAKAGLLDIGYLKATGESIQMVLPKTGFMPEMEPEWKIPPWSNAIERQRAVAHQAYSALVGLYNLEQALKECPGARSRGTTSRCRSRRSASASTRRRAACCRTTWSSATARSPTTSRTRRRPGTATCATSTGPRGRTRTRCRTPDLRGERPGELQGGRHHAGGPQLRPVPPLRRAHVRQGQGPQGRPHADGDVLTSEQLIERVQTLTAQLEIQDLHARGRGRARGLHPALRRRAGADLRGARRRRARSAGRGRRRREPDADPRPLPGRSRGARDRGARQRAAYMESHGGDVELLGVEDGSRGRGSSATARAARPRSRRSSWRSRRRSRRRRPTSRGSRSRA